MSDMAEHQEAISRAVSAVNSALDKLLGASRGQVESREIAPLEVVHCLLLVLANVQLDSALQYVLLQHTYSLVNEYRLCSHLKTT